MSFWNRAFFPEFCKDAAMDDSTIYDTIVRVAGSWIGLPQSFKAIADMYGWTHILLVSDDQPARLCWYGASRFDEVFGNDENYTFTWLRFGSNPTAEEIDDILQQIRSHTRGFISALFRHRAAGNNTSSSAMAERPCYAFRRC